MPQMRAREDPGLKKGWFVRKSREWNTGAKSA